MKNINQQLSRLYEAHWNKLSSGLMDFVNNPEIHIKPSNPLLLKLSNEDAYLSADIKLMIVGKENNGWEGDFYNDMESILKVYEDFAPVGEPYGYMGSFRNHYNIITENIKSTFPDKKVSWVWNNIFKIAKSVGTGTPPAHIHNFIIENFNVFRDEVLILKPHIIIFLTGSGYDTYLKQFMTYTEKTEIEGFKINQLARIHNDICSLTFRTYHPNYMNRTGKSNYTSIYQCIANKIKSELIL